jgi:hypothetical protein
VAPTTTSGSRSSIAWAARPHHAPTRHSLDLVLLRTFERVPSNTDVRAGPARTDETAFRDAVQMVESAAESQIGPTLFLNRRRDRVKLLLGEPEAS